jgi:hypothetical protein
MLVKTIAAITLGFILIIALLVQGAYASMHEDDSSKTIKHRDLVIDLGEGIQTDAELTLPILANRSLPAILLIHGSGNLDKYQFVTPYNRPFREIA